VAHNDDDDVVELIEGLEQLVTEEHYDVEIEMNFKWKTKRRNRADLAKPALKPALKHDFATIL